MTRCLGGSRGSLLVAAGLIAVDDDVSILSIPVSLGISTAAILVRKSSLSIRIS